MRRPLLCMDPADGLCDFCLEATGVVPEFYRIFGADCGRNRAIAPGIRASVDISPMRLGHLLLISETHHRSFAQAVAREGQVRAALEVVVRGIRAQFPRALLVEHGSGSTSATDGPCIDHAHIHVIPWPSGEELSVIEQDLHGQQFVEALGVDVLETVPLGADYLLFDADGLSRVYESPTLPHRQYLRSVLARVDGLDDAPRWAWETRPAPSLFIESIRVLDEMVASIRAEFSAELSHAQLA